MCFIQAKQYKRVSAERKHGHLKTLFTRKEGGDAVKGVMHACTPGKKKSQFRCFIFPSYSNRVETPSTQKELKTQMARAHTLTAMRRNKSALHIEDA